MNTSQLEQKDNDISWYARGFLITNFSFLTTK